MQRKLRSAVEVIVLGLALLPSPAHTQQPKGAALRPTPRQATVARGTIVGPELPTPTDWIAASMLRTAYRGTTIRPSPDPDDANLENEVADLLSRFDAPPPARWGYFEWCDRPDLVVTGWTGVIQGIEKTPRGTLVRVRISPRLVSDAGAATATGDAVLETYLYVRGRLTFANWRPAPDAQPGALFHY